MLVLCCSGGAAAGQVQAQAHGVAAVGPHQGGELRHAPARDAQDRPGVRGQRSGQSEFLWFCCFFSLNLLAS